MTVRAQWFADSIVMDDVDPFACAVVTAPPRDSDLHAELHQLVVRENALFNQGVRCPIKDDPEGTCHACPLRGKDAARRALCEVGFAQERALTQLAVDRHRAV